MLERAQHAALRVGKPVSFGSVTLVPIERVVLQSIDPLWFTAALRLHALVVRDTNGILAFDANARLTSLAALRASVSGLDAVLGMP